MAPRAWGRRSAGVREALVTGRGRCGTGTALPTLEGPDDYISLTRAAVLCGLSKSVLSPAGYTGTLQIVQIGWQRYTTRRWLHQYLVGRSTRGYTKPLPPDYVVPE